MIQIRIDNQHSASVDIFVGISPSNQLSMSHPPTLSSSSTSISHDNEHIYDRLFDQSQISTIRQSKIVRQRSSSITKKNYTLKQILDNVEHIQQQYEQVFHDQKTSSCFFPLKQLTKILKHRKTLKTTKTSPPIYEKIYSNSKSPFTFGGETLQWIALPHPIYENM